MIKRLLIMATIVLLVAGCGVPAKKIYTSDGYEGYSIYCGNQWHHCYEKASEICGPRGYEVLQELGEQQMGFVGGSYGVFGGTTSHNSLIIRCKE